MRILQILLFPLHGSGSGTYADRLAEFEQARGHTVKVLCCDHAVPQRGYETAALVFKVDSVQAIKNHALWAEAERRPTPSNGTASAQADDQRERSAGTNFPPGRFSAIRLPNDTNPDLNFNFP